MTHQIGVLTAGGDSPGLNAAIRGIGKSAVLPQDGEKSIRVIGFRDGFRGLMENRSMRLEGDVLFNLLTLGGTILGTSRDKPHRMPIGGRTMDMTTVMLDNYHRHHLDALVCIGGGGTQKNAMRLAEKGMNIITLPKTIDNDVYGTDVTFGFNTAMEIATSAIDRLHSTAHSHHRIIVVEVMGHNTGWLALGAGLASGADVILIPELPYHIDPIAEAIRRRLHRGKNFSIIAVAEGALSVDDLNQHEKLKEIRKKAKQEGDDKKLCRVDKKIAEFAANQKKSTLLLSSRLEELTGLESRLTILGHLQRGGTPSAFDRTLATQLGTACITAIRKKQFGIMIALKNNRIELIPLGEVVGRRKVVPLDHPWLDSGRRVGVNFGVD
jgi:6-phosphofructokinase 1